MTMRRCVSQVLSTNDADVSCHAYQVPFKRRHSTVDLRAGHVVQKSCFRSQNNNNNSDNDDDDDKFCRTPPRRPRKNVSFHTIDIAEHAYDIGDNPSVCYGCPVQLSWEPQQTISLDLLEYEQCKPKPRSRQELRLPAQARQSLVMQAGASRGQVEDATQEARKIFKSRQRSIKSQRWDSFHYKLEKTSRNLRNVASMDGILRSSCGKEHELLIASYKASSPESIPTYQDTEGGQNSMKNEKDILSKHDHALESDEEEPLSF